MCRGGTRSTSSDTHSPTLISLSEAALSSIKLVDADITVVMDAADLGRPAAERALREAGGKLEAALEALARPADAKA